MTGAPHLALDHCACVVADLAVGAKAWTRLGFRLTPESRQRGAVPGVEGVQPWATANRCAILGRTYLELVGVVDAAAHNPWARFLERREGLHLFAARCDNADRAYSALLQRTDALRPPVPRERVLDVDGEPRTMRFRNIFSRDDLWPEARYIVIEHQTPEYLWQPRYQRHDNGARDLVAVTFSAEDPPALLPRMQALGADIIAHDAGRIEARLSEGGTVHIVRTGDARTGIQGITVSFDDLPGTLAWLESSGVPVQSGPRGPWIGPAETNGFALHLVQDGGPA